MPDPTFCPSINAGFPILTVQAQTLVLSFSSSNGGFLFYFLPESRFGLELLAMNYRLNIRLSIDTGHGMDASYADARFCIL